MQEQICQCEMNPVSGLCKRHHRKPAEWHFRMWFDMLSNNYGLISKQYGERVYFHPARQFISSLVWDIFGITSGVLPLLHLGRFVHMPSLADPSKLIQQLIVVYLWKASKLDFPFSWLGQLVEYKQTLINKQAQATCRLVQILADCQTHKLDWWLSALIFTMPF